MVAVITPYYQENIEIIRQCHRSVEEQVWPCRHVFVADGYAREEINSWNADHIILPKSHSDIGSTPRLIGAYHAIGMGHTSVAFLDVDNWYESTHIHQLMNLSQSSGASFLSSSRLLCRLDGSVMAKCPLTKDGQFVDTSCMLFMPGAFHILHKWVLMPRYGHIIGDRIIYYYICSSGITRSHNENATVYYRCGKEGLYKQLGEKIPKAVKPRPDYDSAHKMWIQSGNPPLY